MSRKNNEQFVARLNGEQQHFGLRKFSVGLASVLLGTSFLLVKSNNEVKADTIVGNQNYSQVSDTDEEENSGDKAQILSTAAKNDSQNKNDYQSTYPANSHQDTAAGAVSVSDSTSNSQNSDKDKTAKVVPTVQANIPQNFNNAVQVGSWSQLTSALNDRNVDKIVLTNDVTADRGSNQLALSKRGIARTVEITSAENQRHALNFGEHYISTFDNSQNGTTDNWNIIFKNLDITSTNKTFTPIFTRNNSVKYSKRNTITMSDVNYTGHQFLRADATNVVFDGTVNVNSVLESGDFAAVDAYSFKVTDGSKVTMNVREDPRFAHGTTEYLWGNAGVRTWYNDGNDAVVIGSAATFNFNPNESVINTKGFSLATTGGSKANMVIAPYAKVVMNMGNGNSSAILNPRNLTVAEGATVDIKTRQDNNGYQVGTGNNGWHVTPISLGTWMAPNNSTSFNIEKDATVKIVRDNMDKPSISGLISMGDPGSSNARTRESLNVADGATLDLQDSAQSSIVGYGNGNMRGALGTPYLHVNGQKDDVYVGGLISLYGEDANTSINFGNVKYVNLQRTGFQHGALIRSEGGGYAQGSVAHTVINGLETPLSQWQAFNHNKKADYTWALDHLDTSNKMGNWAYNYNGRFENTAHADVNDRARGLKFSESDSKVRFTDGKSLSQHADFDNNFSWWKSQRIAFGTDLQKQSDKYKISVAKPFVTHVNAEVNKSNELNLGSAENKANFVWTDKKGKKVPAPVGVKAYWSTVPNTKKATGTTPDETGHITFIFADKSVKTIVAPTVVYGAKAINGLKAHKGEIETMPTAKAATNVSDLNEHNFSIDSVVWKQAPSLEKADPAVPGVTTVNYSDGTKEDVHVTIDVLDVTHGKDHPDQDDINRTVSRHIIEKQPVGDKDFNQSFNFYRDRYTDLAVPAGQTGHITYGAWNEASHVLPAHNATVVPGYQANPESVAAVTVTPESKNSEAIINYAATDQTQIFNYVDKKSNEVVGSANATGKTDTKSNFNALSQMPEGYKLAEGQSANVEFTFAANSTPIDIYVVKLTEAETNQASTDDTVVTHVGADKNSPSLDPKKIDLIWKDKDGNVLKEEQAPKDYTIDWEKVPSTTNVTTDTNKETGVLTITFQDESSENVDVPVVVKGATAINGVKVNQNDPAPAAAGSVNTNDVKQFDLKDVTWKNAPSTAVPGPEVPGTARVNYNDGTYQDVDVTIDVLGVEHGKDHHDDRLIHREIVREYQQYDKFGKPLTVRVVKNYDRDRITDYALSEDDPARVTYTKWTLTSEEKHGDSSLLKDHAQDQNA